MNAILFVGHGSRDPEGNKELLRFTEKLSRVVDAPVKETCFLELASPDIPQGIQRCVEQGANRITLIPVMLFAAGHAKIHIPLAIQEAQEQYPGVQFRYGRPIEVDEAVLDLLEQRVADINPGVREETAILLVGRGSSDLYANSDLYKIARMFWEKNRYRWVEVSFIGVTEPLFAEGLERCIRLGAKRIVTLPYFLFTGVLIKRMRAILNEYEQRHPEIEFHMAAYLGFDEGLIPIVQKRVSEVRQGEGVAWKALAEKAIADGHDHHHHHHHHDCGHHDHTAAHGTSHQAVRSKRS
ncbi:sirohydrochlorin chelatase [Thermoactinomyces sp. CICC 10523]|uniref:sirohydrochlorin chelatase n=1 Tax=Thermoactinomyces sp. CICC 10523 TaxID=2767428 RepID=UPI0018DBECCA|nr:sirohydrochlorin chelatase [Thermoactinomyces sp. CICC 10523]MBH8599339.1 sirohydrochlorin chelatase [Thermoactinomyces sp. CICC 10523]